jgi:hypothetical protein
VWYVAKPFDTPGVAPPLRVVLRFDC